jgi:hypothetical protein
MGENLDIGLEWTDWMVGLKLHKAVERLSRERKAVELKCQSQYIYYRQFQFNIRAFWLLLKVRRF